MGGLCGERRVGGEEGGAEQSLFVGRLTAFEAEMAAQAAALQQQKQEMEQALQASPHAPRALTCPTYLGKPDDLSTVFQAILSRPRTENKNNRQERESSASDAKRVWLGCGQGLAALFGEEADNAAWVLRTLCTFAKQYRAAAELNKKVHDKM